MFMSLFMSLHQPHVHVHAYDPCKCLLPREVMSMILQLTMIRQPQVKLIIT